MEIDIEFLKSLAKEAGDRAVTMLDAIKPEYKDDDSLVTHIDRETELSLRSQLASRYPDFAFQGEEYGRVGDTDRPLWAVDPIDGTTNMVYGIPIWGVSIGLVSGDSVLAGVFYMPVTKELFWGEQGKGSYCNDKPLLQRSLQNFHREDTLGLTSNSIKRNDSSAFPGRIRSLGSIAAEVCYTARGSLCAHVGSHEGINDLAAAFCIAYEAGCSVEYFDGEPVSIRDMVLQGATKAPFIVGTKETIQLTRSIIKPRT